MPYATLSIFLYYYFYFLFNVLFFFPTCPYLYICVYIQCFPQDFVRPVAAGDVIIICIFMTSLRQVCVQTSFGTSFRCSAL